MPGNVVAVELEPRGRGWSLLGEWPTSPQATYPGAPSHDGRRKAVTNARKHGVSFKEAASVFADPLALAVEDAVDPGRTLLIG